MIRWVYEKLKDKLQTVERATGILHELHYE